MSKFLRAALVLLTGCALAACDGDDSSGAAAGAACTGGGDCASGACAPTANGNICVDSCDATGSCPDGFECQMAGSGNYCVPSANGGGGEAGMMGDGEAGMMGGGEAGNEGGGEAGMMGGGEAGTPGGGMGGTPGGGMGGTPGGGMGGTPGGGNPGLDAGAQACQALLGCLNGCGQADMACQQQCFNSASPEGQQRFQAVATCAQQNQCQDDACLNQFCAEEMAGCGLGGGGGNPGGGGGGNATCGEFFMCAQMCPQGDQGCLQQCFGQLSPEAQQVFMSLQQCIQSNMCETDECVEENCGAEIEACFGGAGPGGGEPPAPGNANCGEFFDCANACPANDQACLQQCFGSLSEEARDLFTTWQMCAINGCGNPPEDACVTDNLENNCDAETRACIGQGRMWGEAGCGDSWTCILDCAPMDGACQEACIDGATEDAFFELQDVFGCIAENMCEDPSMCPACQAEIDACGAN